MSAWHRLLQRMVLRPPHQCAPSLSRRPLRLFVFEQGRCARASDAAMDAGDLETQLGADLELLRKDPAALANWLRANRQNLYKGTELELLKDDLKTRVLLATRDGRKPCLAAISALDKCKALPPFQ